MIRTMVVVYLGSAGVAGALAAVSWHRRARTPAAIGLGIAMLGVMWWSLGDALLEALILGRASAVAERSSLAWIIPGGGVAVLGAVMMCQWVADPSWWPSRRIFALLVVDPLVMVATAATDPWWHLAVGSWGGPRWGPGIAFWPHTAYTYGIVTVEGRKLLRAVRHGAPTQRRQVISLLAGMGVVAAGCAFSTLTPPGRALPDLSPLCFLITGLIAANALFRQGLLTVVPIARGLVMDRLSDAVVVLDPDGRILDINPAGIRLARRLAPDLPGHLVGLRAHRILEGSPGSRSVAFPPADGQYRTTIEGDEVVLDVRSDEMHDRSGERIASVTVIRDITLLHRQRAELAAANARLREQVDTIEALRTELVEQATRDELTGLHNRRHLTGALERDLHEARTQDDDLCLLLLDLDHFKSVNDTYGHDIGDALLVATARALTDTLRDTDTLARYGGEEFVVVLPATDLDHAAARAEELRARAATVAVPTPRGPVSPTISIGVASRRRLTHDDTPHLLKAADEALYRAKSLGRNRVVLAADDTTAAASTVPEPA